MRTSCQHLNLTAASNLVIPRWAYQITMPFNEIPRPNGLQGQCRSPRHRIGTPTGWPVLVEVPKSTLKGRLAGRLAGHSLKFTKYVAGRLAGHQEDGKWCTWANKREGKTNILLQTMNEMTNDGRWQKGGMSRVPPSCEAGPRDISRGGGIA